jgi:Tfp pilus assembly protein PilP
MELLVFPEKKPARSQRNIFTVQISGGLESEFENVLSNRENIERTEAGQPEDQARFAVNIRYMGYVKSGSKITALIVFQGEALAVEKGEMIALELQVVEITTEEIEVIGPDRQLLKFPLEGDLL